MITFRSGVRFTYNLIVIINYNKNYFIFYKGLDEVLKRLKYKLRYRLTSFCLAFLKE